MSNNAELEQAQKLLLEYKNFSDGLMWEIKNLCNKLDRKEEQGWEGTKRRGVYQPAQQERLTSLLNAVLYIP